MSVKVFLGGTCNESTWRDRLIKMLEENGIEYFNPVVDNWNHEAQRREVHERSICDFCLYTITPKMTGVYSIAEVTDDSNKKPESTIFCVLRKDDNLVFDNGLWRSLRAVASLVQRNGAHVCYSLEDVVKIIKSNS